MKSMDDKLSTSMLLAVVAAAAGIGVFALGIALIMYLIIESAYRSV